MTPSLFAHGATHWGAPFVGRRRELGILTHLIEDGLSSSWCLVRVAGEPGSGRRRLIAEALRRGPDAEWVHLAPGETTSDLRRWLCTELPDLLDGYPEAPYPSWALHVLARWEPGIRRWARIPAWTREELPAGSEPELVGSAIGALLAALAAQTQVIVDAGLWPPPHDAGRRVLTSMCRCLGVPGVVVIAALDPDPPGMVDAEGTRTLALGPLLPDDVAELAARWIPGVPSAEFAAWLHRVTGGRPHFINETVRWLEELGRVRVDDDHGRVELLHPLDRFPLPFNLHAVMDARYQRLPTGAARLLALIAREDGRLDREALRERLGLDSEAFEEALATLRRRELLLRRTTRRPVASTSPLWGGVVEAAGVRRPRQRRGSREPRGKTATGTSSAPLAQGLARLERLTTAGADEMGRDAAPELAGLARLARGRTGPGWDALRGRLAEAAARHRRQRMRDRAAQRWIAWGLAHTSPDVHPALRRSLRRLDAEILETGGRLREAAAVREHALAESLDAGHLVSAALLKAALAETMGRLDDPAPAHRLAREAEIELGSMGLVADAKHAREAGERTAPDPKNAQGAHPPLRAAPPRGKPEFTGVELRLLNRPSVVRAGSFWPRSLWPQWWLSLWCGAVSASLLGRGFARAAADRAAAEAGDAPDADLEHLLVLANQLLRGRETVAGGLRLDGDRIAVAWSGIRCDVRELFALVERATTERGSDAAALHRRILDLVQGAYLPGIAGEEHDAVRERLRETIRLALAAVLADGGEITAAERACWLENAGRAGPVAVVFAELSEASGRPRAAFVLRRESP